MSPFANSSEKKMLERIEDLRGTLSSMIYNEQFKVFGNVSSQAMQYKVTKQKLLEEIIFLTNNIHFIRSLQTDMTYKHILDDLPQLVLVVNNEFRVIYVNNWFELKDQLIGRDLNKVFPGVHHTYKKLKVLIGSKNKETVEIDHVSGDGAISKLKLNVKTTRENNFVFTGNFTENIDFTNSIIGDYLSLCAYCNNVKNIFEDWFETENLNLLKEKLPVSHGICNNCYSKEMDKITESYSTDN